jgi:2,3-bisphosphoglycerate-dependent phosphoglycerate mutase
MRVTRLLLIRHGHTAENGPHRRARMSGVTDVPLSGLGHRQICALRDRLLTCGERFPGIYTSPLTRARETARALERAGLGELHECDGLREIDCGEYDGMLIEEVKRRSPGLWEANLRQDDADFRWPGGESYRDFRSRCIESLRANAERHAGARVAVVTHAGVISQVLGWSHEESPARWECFRPGNASLTEVEWQAGTIRLASFDDRGHLRDL